MNFLIACMAANHRSYAEALHVLDTIFVRQYLIKSSHHFYQLQVFPFFPFRHCHFSFRVSSCCYRIIILSIKLFFFSAYFHTNWMFYSYIETLNRRHIQRTQSTRIISLAQVNNNNNKETVEHIAMIKSLAAMCV